MEWSQVPKGICLVKMFHPRTSDYSLHIHMKLNDGPWYDQPFPPWACSQEMTKDTHREFWAWAEKNLPIYEYQRLM